MADDILDVLDNDFLDEETEEKLDEDFESALEAVDAELLPLDGEEEDGVMSEARAREITEAIRSAATVTFILLARAHESGAHKALGYDTWAEYVQTEFDMSAQRSYQLLDLSKVTSEIESVVPEGTNVKLTEAQARDIKRELPRVTEQIREATEDADPDTASAKVNEIVEGVREQKKADEKAVADKEREIAAAREQGEQAGLEAAADAMLDRSDGPGPDDTMLEVSVDDGSDLSPEDSMNLYNFFNVLSGLTALPEPDIFVKTVPKARREEIENQLLEAASWLNRFQTLWELED